MGHKMFRLFLLIVKKNHLTDNIKLRLTGKFFSKTIVSFCLFLKVNASGLFVVTHIFFTICVSATFIKVVNLFVA